MGVAEGNTVIYVDDIQASAAAVASIRLSNWLDLHPEHLDDFDLHQELFRRVFHPWVCAKMTVRLLSRGHTLIQGENPVERPSIARRRARFLSSLGDTIGLAIARSEGQIH